MNEKVENEETEELECQHDETECGVCNDCGEIIEKGFGEFEPYGD